MNWWRWEDKDDEDDEYWDEKKLRETPWKLTEKSDSMKNAQKNVAAAQNCDHLMEKSAPFWILEADDNLL